MHYHYLMLYFTAIVDCPKSIFEHNLDNWKKMFITNIQKEKKG